MHVGMGIGYVRYDCDATNSYTGLEMAACPLKCIIAIRFCSVLGLFMPQLPDMSFGIHEYIHRKSRWPT